MAATPVAMGFSLLGPFTPWQTTALGYQLNGTIGGPMNLGEGFRWNVPVITYSFDRSFLDYFGPNGVIAIDQAMKHFNDLPSASKISPDLAGYSPQTMRENYEAAALGIVDLKTTAMSIIMEELGFADPIRFAFTLRARETRTVGTITITNYTTVVRNYDPVTYGPSAYVNGVLYTYTIQEFQNPDFADAIESVRFTTDNNDNTPVARALFASGLFRTGLTRDDVGAMRYLYNPNNYAVENLLPDVAAGQGNISGWIPYIAITNTITVTNTIVGTNALGTNILSTGLRGGRNKLSFQKVLFDPVLGSFFTPVESSYTDVAVSTNRELVMQPVTRTIIRPDIIFTSEDLGLANNGISPLIFSRTTTASWIDNDALNGSDEVGAFAAGPGVITPQVRIAFTDQLPIYVNSTSSAFLNDGFPGEDSAFTLNVWGSFDGSTNAPIIYPQSQLLNINRLRQSILSGVPPQ